MKESKFVSDRQNCLRYPELNALTLKIIAMVLMFCDHAWSTGVFPYDILTHIGRIAFPIFAFQVVEGFFRTKDVSRYFKRMLLFALISEIPFNIVTGGIIINPLHQNVLFSFCISIGIMCLIEKAKEKGMVWYIVVTAACAVLGYFVGFLTFVDYFGYGILTVLVFYLSYDKKYRYLLEFVGLFIINWHMIGGLVFLVPLFGIIFEIPEQGLALFALPLIWSYKGKQGPHNKTIQYACYAFYPVHLLVLGIIARIMFSWN